MSPDDQFDKALEKFCSKHGIQALQQSIERGDFVGEQEAKARAFLSKKIKEAVARYKLSPEYSALRQANAAEQANTTARRAYVMSVIAVVVSLFGLVIQLING